MIKDFNQTESVYNSCFRNSSAIDPSNQSLFRDPVVISEDGDLVLVVPKTPIPNTRQIMIGISVSAACDVVLRKYFSAAADHVDETFVIGAAGTYAFESVDALDSCEVYAGNNRLALSVNCFATVIARP